MLSELKATLSGKKTSELASELADAKKVSEQHSQSISSLKEEITNANSNIKTLVEQQKQLLKENTEALETVRELKEQLSDSIDSIKVMSSTIQNNLVKKITGEINDLTQEVSSKLSGSEKLKKEIEEVATNVKDELKNLNEEIKKLKTVSSNIKAEDFELTKFANQLKAADSEKLKLIREIDTMQRLVSSLRRRQH